MPQPTNIVSKRVFAFIVALFVVPAIDASEEESPASPPSQERLQRVMEITDAVLDHHLDPPARQQMVLRGLLAAYREAGVPVPPGLSKKVSAAATPEQIAKLLADSWPSASDKASSPKAVDNAFTEGLVAAAPDTFLITGKEAKVAEQFEGNLYVGIQVALGMDDEAKRPKFFEVFEGGPADRAGIKKGDLLNEVDGAPTKGIALRDTIERLRGELGSKVVIKVENAKSKEVRILELTRERLARPTVTGIRKSPSGGWQFRLESDPTIGYLRIQEITGSTPTELRRFARQLEADGVRALILDLRALIKANLHATVLVADSLLEAGPIGRLRTVEKVMTYQSDSDALFRSWPIVALVDVGTSGPAEWLAAALQDTHRAVLVGARTRGNVTTMSTIPVLHGTWAVTLPSGRLERADGRSLLSPQGVTPTGQAQAVRHRGADGPPVGGVTPDHVVGKQGGDATGRPIRQRPAAPAPAEAAPASDPAFTKAVELLRALTKPVAARD